MDIYESKKCIDYFSHIYMDLAAYYGFTVIDASESP